MTWQAAYAQRFNARVGIERPARIEPVLDLGPGLAALRRFVEVYDRHDAEREARLDALFEERS